MLSLKGLIKVVSVLVLSLGVVTLGPTKISFSQDKSLVIAAVTTPKGFDPDVWVPGMIESGVNVYEGLTRYGRKRGDDGRLIIHTAPNRWYDAYAYPVVRMVRSLLGQGQGYPKDPRAIIPVNQDVHVNEQDILSMHRNLSRAGFKSKVWLDSPPQNRNESRAMAGLRWFAFEVPPFHWFFEREVFAVARKK